MPDGLSKNDWSEYSRLVISELERLNVGQERSNLNDERLSTKIDEFRNEINRRLNEELTPIKADILQLHESVAKQSVLIDHLDAEVKDSKEDARHARRTAASAVITLVSALLVGLLVWYFTHASVVPEKRGSSSISVLR
jgi:phosphoenolpyruvate-protein kinase (PTS system EI component)